MKKIINNAHQQLHQVQTNKNHQPQHEMKKNNQNAGGGYIILINNVCVRCCGRGRQNVTSAPRWWGWLVVPDLWYLVYLIRDFFVVFRLRICVSLRACLVRISNHGCIFIEWSSDWIVAAVVVVFTLNMHSGHFVLLFFSFVWQKHRGWTTLQVT